jgi:hypothetical protein
VRNALSHASMIANRFDINRHLAALAFINISDLNRRNYSHKVQHRIRQQTILGRSATGLKTSSEKNKDQEKEVDCTFPFWVEFSRGYGLTVI